MARSLNTRLAAEILAVENQGRPPVQIWGTEGMVSSMHPEATRAALEVLNKGGNAIDAAVALGATISVTSGNLSGLGGDSAWLFYLAEPNEFYCVDGYCKCPQGITPDVLQERFGLNRKDFPLAYKEEPVGYRDSGIIVSMVPGTPALWARVHERFGQLSFTALMSRAIELAEKGVPVNRYLAGALHANQAKVGRFESSRKIFFRQDRGVLKEGERLVQKDLAKTLRRLASGGYSGFYEGETAKAIVDYSDARGGCYSVRDFAEYDVAWRPSERSSYRGYEVVVAGAPTSGVHLLQELNIIENFPLAELGYHSAESLHVLIEAAKIARADRRLFSGDPDYMEIPVGKLLDKNYAAQKAKQIQFGLANCVVSGVETTQGSTTHFVVIDREGNTVSAVQTVGRDFGCGEVVEGTGILFNDRTWWMALRDSPNLVAPGHRPNIGHSPVILRSQGRPFMALGSPGGDGIIQYVMQTIVNVIDYGFNIQDAIEAPRFRCEDLCYKVGMERRIAQEVRDTLKSWRHYVIDYPEWTEEVGGVEGILVDFKTAHLMGGYDPRRNSMALGV